jgi:hypothetical protein
LYSSLKTCPMKPSELRFNANELLIVENGRGANKNRIDITL